jgi:hypothetical protein
LPQRERSCSLPRFGLTKACGRFDNPPLKPLQEKYHFTPTQQWLDHIRLSSVRLNDGGSGSFVSPHGLLLTNHHVARGQLQKNSSAEHDYLRDGIYASTSEQEMKSPDLEVNVLVSMENVTPRIMEAQQKAKTPEEQFAARKAAVAEIERESQQKTGFRSDVVTLYQGGEYWLYRYKKYTDVRLVFAPEQQIAFSAAIRQLHVPALRPGHGAVPRLRKRQADREQRLSEMECGRRREDELVFVSGHPGSTSRLDTMAQLEFLRDVGTAQCAEVAPQQDRITGALLGEGRGASPPGRLPDFLPPEQPQGR